MNLNNVRIFKPVNGKTLREQLRGHKLAGSDVVAYLRTFDTEEKSKDFVPPAHWDTPGRVPTNGGNIYLFSLTYITPHPAGGHLSNGVCWATDGFHVGHQRFFEEEDVLDVTVGNGWESGDWILIESK